ncbi:MAG TPA: allantoate amidohydrolase [Rugosimonospora sp.]|nr:allantoate amidohydrolase [Rugosimonospora sp.]
MSFAALWRELLPIGRDRNTGGYRRFSWSGADLAARDWFTHTARARGLDVRTDRNGNLWAWWGAPGPGAVVTGSHLDSVPDGGAFDGPLGIVSALAAVDLLRARGARPVRPLAVTVYVEEEGARFGVPCLGSRLLTGAIPAERARGLRDAQGVTWGAAMESAGLDPEAIGPDEALLGQLGAFVELHVEQGRALVHRDAPLGVASAVWPHGRWRLDFTGEANHAGTTQLADRRDPMLTFATTVLAARKKARLAGALATIGKVLVQPNATNAVPSTVHAWLDARAPDEQTLAEVIAEILRAATERATRDGTAVLGTRESYTPAVEFAGELRDRIRDRLDGVPVLPTGAGHDAAVLAERVPAAMLFVRNPTGVSHAPTEHATPGDCEAGVVALASVLEDLACRS